MGLIKAITGAAGGLLADQWKEFFYCEALDKDILMVKGQKRISDRSSNTKASDNIISNGSGIAVADGQCMIIVEQGRIVEVCAEPGEFTYDSSTEPTIFEGKLGKSIIDSFKTLGKRFTYGGDTAKDQRVYYFNTKELIDNKFGTPSPIPFRFVDTNINLDIDISVRCNGVYSYKITDPLKFYTNVCGNVTSEYRRSEIDAQLKAEFISALTPAMGKLAELKIRPNALAAHTAELEEAMKAELQADWSELRGLSIVTINLMPITLSKEDEELIKNAQRTAMMKDATYAAATLVDAQAEAMKTAAGNEAGAMMGFMGMNMANTAGGFNAQSLYQTGAQQQAFAAQQQAAQQAAAPAAAAPTAPQGGWTCACGKSGNDGKFCEECGAKKPETSGEWICSCGAKNDGKFCPECGSKKPEAAAKYRCSKCGWNPADATKPPKFCPECGKAFGADDIVG